MCDPGERLLTLRAGLRAPGRTAESRVAAGCAGRGGRVAKPRDGWLRCPNRALGGSWRRTQPFVARWVMRRRVALREDDYLLTACLAAEGSLRGWSAAGLLGRECRTSVALAFSGGGGASVSSSAHWEQSSGPQSLCVPSKKRMVPTSQGDSSKCYSHPTSSSLINPPQQGSQEEVPPWFSDCYCHPLNLQVATLGLHGDPLP